MKRPDADIIRRALKRGRLVMGDTTKLGEVIKLGLDLPLMSFTGKDFKGTEIYGFAKRGEAYDCNEPVFDEFVIHYEQSMTLEIREKIPYMALDQSRRHKKEVDAEVWACFLDPIHPYLRTLENYPQTIDEHIQGWKLRPNYEERPMIPETLKFLTVILEYKGEPLTYIWQGWTAMSEDKHVCSMNTEGAEEFWGDQIDGLAQWALNTTLHSFGIWAYCKYGDKHMVEVVPTKPKSKQARRSALNKSRPWNSSTGPHILFLDRMPTTQSGGGTGSGTSPKPHRRRGHWKTLSHPRFRHHPQYGRQIYVKPSFVGPRQVTYEGNIYRLVEPLEGEV